jgi:hypothetical protein
MNASLYTQSIFITYHFGLYQLDSIIFVVNTYYIIAAGENGEVICHKSCFYGHLSLVKTKMFKIEIFRFSGEFDPDFKNGLVIVGPLLRFGRYFCCFGRDFYVLFYFFE